MYLLMHSLSQTYWLLLRGNYYICQLNHVVMFTKSIRTRLGTQKTSPTLNSWNYFLELLYTMAHSHVLWLCDCKLKSHHGQANFWLAWLVTQTSTITILVHWSHIDSHYSFKTPRLWRDLTHFWNIACSNHFDVVALLEEHWTSKPKVVWLIPTMVKLIFS